jgi:hypothetical protein
VSSTGLDLVWRLLSGCNACQIGAMTHEQKGA